VGVEYVRYAVDNPSRFRFMYGTPPLPPGENGSPILARHAEVLQVFADAVSEAQRENVIAGKRADRIAAQMWAQAHGLATLTIADALDGARGAMVGFMVGARPQDPAWRPPGIS